MLIYPKIDPIAFKIGIFKVYWYGIMYLVAFSIAWCLALLRARKNISWTREQINDLIFYCALGVVIGGRVGYTLIYNLLVFISNPLVIIKAWEGGMSFHGGLIGVVIAIYLFAKKTRKSFSAVTDFVSPLVPLGLAVGRVGNFINGELFGRVTNMPWGMIYPMGGFFPRHPSELYEFFLEGILLFIIMWWYSSKPKPPFAVSALFLVCYGVFRCIAEFFRQPDPQLNFIAFGWVTMGQLLSGAMILIGIFYLWRIYFCINKK
jgi:phosphatidylglycerol---prolipoprotein diacylglyceryl transferase